MNVSSFARVFVMFYMALRLSLIPSTIYQEFYSLPQFLLVLAANLLAIFTQVKI